MRKMILVAVMMLVVLSLPWSAQAMEKTKLEWDAVTTLSTGVTITPGMGIVTYKVYCGTGPITYTKSTLVSSATMTSITGVSCSATQINYFAVTAILDGESAFSNEVSATPVAGKFYDFFYTPTKPGGCRLN